jgi:hypothetical protein
MSMTNVKTNFYYVNVCKGEYEKKMSRLWCKIVLKIGVEQTQENERSYFYLQHLWGPSSKKLAKKNLCVHQNVFFNTFLN